MCSDRMCSLLLSGLNLGDITAKIERMFALRAATSSGFHGEPIVRLAAMLRAQIFAQIF